MAEWAAATWTAVIVIALVGLDSRLVNTWSRIIAAAVGINMIAFTASSITLILA